MLQEVAAEKASEAVGGALMIGTNALGAAVYTTRPVEKGEVLLRFWGNPVPRRTRHSIQVDRDLHVEPELPARFLNHSCEPSAALLLRRGVETAELHALRPLQAGEEVTVDYATFETEIGFIAGSCLCGARSCRGRVTGYRDLPEDRRRAYGPYVAEYLREAD